MNETAATRLEVAKADFVQELKRLGKVLGRRNVGDALLRYDEGKLRIRIGGAEVGMEARGQWLGEAWVSAAWIRALTKVPPPKDPIVIQVVGGRMRIGGSSIACRWQAPGVATIGVPLDMGLRERLRLAYVHSQVELAKSGLTSVAAEAQAELAQRIAAAAELLGPCGVTQTDLRLLCTGKLKLGE